MVAVSDVLRSAAVVKLLMNAGYPDCAERLLSGDPDLVESVADPEYLQWLLDGAPGYGPDTDLVVPVHLSLQDALRVSGQYRYEAAARLDGDIVDADGCLHNGVSVSRIRGGWYILHTTAGDRSCRMAELVRLFGDRSDWVTYRRTYAS